MKNCRMASIVLAAGYSSRMNSFKPFLEFGGHTAVETVVNTFKDTGIEEVVVVAGHRGSEVADKLKGSGVVCTWNKNYSRGMYSSVLKGIEALDDSVGAFFIIPVDIPLVKKYTLELMKRKYIESGKGILYPVYCGKRGHPPLIDIKYRQAILDSSGEGGLERILLSFSDDSMDVCVFDAAVIMDMDKKEDYDALLSYYLMGAPNRDECSAILKAYYVPESIIKHCSEVARVSRDILKSLKGYGCALDAAVLEAAALLHDIAKGQKDHAVKGAMILEKIGYEKVGHIISTHMDLDVEENDIINENEILYLSDKLVNEDKIMTLEDRRALYLRDFCGNTGALNKINKRFNTAGKIVKKVERITGKGFIYG